MEYGSATRGVRRRRRWSRERRECRLRRLPHEELWLLGMVRGPSFPAPRFGRLDANVLFLSFVSGNVLGFRILRACPPCQKTRALAADALLFSFRGASVTALPRTISIPYATLPSPSTTPEPSDAEEPLRWLQLPTPQADWVSGLVSEPGDWIDNDDEWWWVRHGFGRQCRRLERGERHGTTPCALRLPRSFQLLTSSL